MPADVFMTVLCESLIVVRRLLRVYLVRGEPVPLLVLAVQAST